MDIPLNDDPFPENTEQLFITQDVVSISPLVNLRPTFLNETYPTIGAVVIHDDDTISRKSSMLNNMGNRVIGCV